MSILIKDVLFNDNPTDIYIEGRFIKEIDAKRTTADTVIDGKDKAVFPSFVNGHAHCPMTLFRGFGDDLPLMEWLETIIWPKEDKITEDDVYWGAKLACLEMIKSGTTYFNDMYWFFYSTAKAVEEMGLKASLGTVFIDMFDPNKAKEQIKLCQKLFEKSHKYSDRIRFSFCPHAIYTVSTGSLMWIKEYADKHNILIHTHLSETKKEVDDCIAKFKKRPVEYLHDIGMLDSNLVVAHCVWVDDKEADLLKKYDVKVVHNPVSNLKLGVGGFFNYPMFKGKGILIGLGTDGAGSNNSLDMIEEMKVAAIMQKWHVNDTTVMPAGEVLQLATTNGHKMFNTGAGTIEEGAVADLILIDMSHPQLAPNHNIVSNLVYASNGTFVDTTICDGKVLMLNRKVDGEDDIVKEATKVAKAFINR